MAFQFNEELEEMAQGKAHGQHLRFDPEDAALQSRFQTYWQARETHRHTISRTLYRTEMNAASKADFIRRYGQQHYIELPMKRQQQ